jgi:hypothetical protein
MPAFWRFQYSLEDQVHRWESLYRQREKALQQRRVELQLLPSPVSEEQRAAATEKYLTPIRDRWDQQLYFSVKLLARSSLWQRRLLALVAVLGQQGRLWNISLSRLQQDFNSNMLLQQRLQQFCYEWQLNPLGFLERQPTAAVSMTAATGPRRGRSMLQQRRRSYRWAEKALRRVQIQQPLLDLGVETYQRG